MSCLVAVGGVGRRDDAQICLCTLSSCPFAPLFVSLCVLVSSFLVSSGSQVELGNALRETDSLIPGVGIAKASRLSFPGSFCEPEVEGDVKATCDSMECSISEGDRVASFSFQLLRSSWLFWVWGWEWAINVFTFAVGILEALKSIFNTAWTKLFALNWTV